MSEHRTTGIERCAWQVLVVILKVFDPLISGGEFDIRKDNCLGFNCYLPLGLLLSQRRAWDSRWWQQWHSLYGVQWRKLRRRLRKQEMMYVGKNKYSDRYNKKQTGLRQVFNMCPKVLSGSRNLNVVCVDKKRIFI